MNLLVVSYVLPPNLYSQSIQIGRLLYHLNARIGALTGQVETLSCGLDAYPDFDHKLAFRRSVSFHPQLTGFLHRVAANLLPFYARVPDELTGWVPLAEDALIDQLAQEQFIPDVLVTFGEPMSDHLLGLRVKKRYGLPWVAHFSDPWVDNPCRRRFFLSNLRNRTLERDVINNADRVIFTSEETVNLVMDKYPPEWRAKVRVLTHSFEPTFYAVSDRSLDKPFTLRYLGNFYGHRTPMPLFKALAEINHRFPEELKNVRVELIGGVPPRMLSNAAYRSLPSGLVSVKSTVDYMTSLNLMADSDILLVIDAPAEVSVFLPGKLVDYLGVGVPILGIVPPGASAQLITKLGGCVANPCRVGEIAAALRQSLAEIRERRTAETSAAWGNPEVRAAYRAEAVAERFRSILGELAGDGVQGG